MPAQAKDIILGDRTFTIRPLTIGQVEAIEPILIANSGTKSAIDIAQIAIGRDYAEDAKSLRDLEATTGDIAIAFTTVLRLGGFAPAEDASGEVEAPKGAE
jgi:hypothetical protein